MLRLILRLLSVGVLLLAGFIAGIRVGYALVSPQAALYAHPGCEGPCVLGIEPGRTTSTEAEAILDGQNMAYSTYFIEYFHSDLTGVAVRENRDADRLIEYVESDDGTRVRYITTVRDGACTPEFILELGPPDDAYAVPQEQLALFIYRDYGLVFIFTERERGADLAQEVLGVWQVVRRRPVVGAWSVNPAIDLFNYCR